MNFKSAGLGAIILLAVCTIQALPASAQLPSSFSFTLQESSLVTCWSFGVTFNATMGQSFSIKWSENTTGPISLNFYLAPLTSLREIWLCDQGPVSLYSNDGAYGTTNWIAPSAGNYAALLVNYSYRSVSGTLTISTVNATLSASAIGPSAVRRQICFAPGCIGG